MASSRGQVIEGLRQARPLGRRDLPSWESSAFRNEPVGPHRARLALWSAVAVGQGQAQTGRGEGPRHILWPDEKVNKQRSSHEGWAASRFASSLRPRGTTTVGAAKAGQARSGLGPSLRSLSSTDDGIEMGRASDACPASRQSSVPTRSSSYSVCCTASLFPSPAAM